MRIDTKNLSRWGSMAIKIVANPMIGVWLLSLGFVCYKIGYDTLFKPQWDRLATLDSSLNAQRQVVEAKKKEREQFDIWEKQLKGLKTTVPQLTEGQFPKIMASTLSSQIIDLAKGTKRSEALGDPLPEPHNKREFVSISQTGDTVVNILASEETQPAQGGPPPGGPPEGSPSQPGGPGGPHGMGGPGGTTPATKINMWKFDYDIKLKGTYPALMDFVNQLVEFGNLVVIDKITMNLPVDTKTPSAEEQPDFPVPLDMVLSFSVYLYDPNIQNLDPNKPPG